VVRRNNGVAALHLPGFRVTRNPGVAPGIVLRSRSAVDAFAELQTVEKTREDAFELMLRRASELGANAMIGARYDATEIMNGVSEVPAYGTVEVEPAA
jgi:uncharacterized protein YbjQ (UPF0145 family)